MATKTIRVLRKFFINGVMQDIGKVITVTEVEAVGLIAIKKAEIIPDAAPAPKVEAKKEEPKKEEQKTEASETKDASPENKKGGKRT